MTIISVEIMKIVDERETQIKTEKKIRKETNKDKKEQRGTEAIVKGSELNDLSCI